jgi:predicted dehydrogenase
MLRIAIVGCGRIAESHAAQIRRVPGCELIAVCDAEELMARQFCQRFQVRRWYGTVGELLKDARPDIVHVTTPPQSHQDIARLCLERGTHVYVEKPFTLLPSEAEELISMAQERRLKITVGHDDQFRHAARRLRQMVASGYLGGIPVHMESHYGYDMGGGAGYARSLLQDRNHWVRRLPGQLLQNVISHGIARVVEFMPSESIEVVAKGFVSPSLRRAGEDEIVDELRVMMFDTVSSTTAYFTFSSQMRPSLHEFRIYGPRNGLVLDQDHESVLKLEGARHRSVAEQIVAPVRLGQQYLSNALRNAGLFLKSDLHAKEGMRHLFELFYRSVAEDYPVPIPYREILTTTRLMDQVFRQIGERSGGAELARMPALGVGSSHARGEILRGPPLDPSAFHMFRLPG